MNITVLYGGDSPEREVSLRSGARVGAALRTLGHTVRAFDYRAGSLPGSFLLRLREADAVFLALHGGDGEDGRLQVRLEDAGIFHYTGSGAHAAALAMDKNRALCVARERGVPVPIGGIWQEAVPQPRVPFPAIIKPVSGGSSSGFQFIREEALLPPPPREAVLLEECLPGREYTVAVLDGRALPIVEICPLRGRYDYRHKYQKGATREICPAPIDVSKAERLSVLSLSLFTAFALRDFSRFDFKDDSAGNPRFLEVNTLPGMTDTSLFPLAAKTAGISFPKLCERICELARERKK